MPDTTDDSFITDTLQRGTADLQTPLAEIAAHSITAGRRLRRRRTAGVVLGSAACVAALSAGLVGVTHLGASDRVVDPGFGAGSANSPTATATPTASPTPSGAAEPTSQVPVRLELAGWTCEEFAIDQKSWCIGPDGVNASLSWRPASDFDAWHGGDADKTDDWVGPLHGDWFATVSLTERNAALAQQLGEALVWAD